MSSQDNSLGCCWNHFSTIATSLCQSWISGLSVLPWGIQIRYGLCGGWCIKHSIYWTVWATWGWVMIPLICMARQFSWWWYTVCEGSAVALFIGNDGRVLEHQRQQFVDDEESSQHDLSCRWLGHEFIRAGRGQMFPLHAYSFPHELKVLAPCLITHHSLSQKPITLCLVALPVFHQ